MKTKNNYLLVFFLFALLSFTACQDEATEINNPDLQETIDPNSTLGMLISNTTANYGAADNILDGSSCFSVELPVTIVISDITIVIETEDDLEQLEDLFNDLNDDDDFLDFVFPITLIFSDYTELVIENEDQLASYINTCEEEDDFIECVDFVYPIYFSVFNSEFNLIDTIIIENDEALYEFFEDLEEDENVLIVSLNYPVILEFADGETLEVDSNEALAEAIASAEDDCDDDEEEGCEEEEITLNLVECPWEVFLYINDNLDDLDGPYIFTFSDDGILVIDGITDQPNTTTWELSETDNGLELNIASFYYYEQQYGNWLVIECDDNELKFEHLTVEGTGLFFEQDCEDDLDCSITDISSILQECPWDFSNEMDAYDNYQMVFNANGELLLPEGLAVSAIGGYWSLTANNEGIILTISELTAFQEDLEGDWLIVECNDDYITIVKENTVIVLEQYCQNDEDVFNCFSDYELVECANDAEEAEFNISANTIGLTDCIESYIPSFHISLPDAEANVGAISNTESYVSTSGQVYLRIEAESGNFEVFSIYLNAFECNMFECFESFDAVIELCDEGNDGFEIFNLTIAFANCTPSANVVTYHETLADAEDGANPIANPEAYTNIAIEQTIYVKVEIDNQFQVFPILLLLEDCSQAECSEEDVDAFLLECIWNAVNYNGSDNLMEWNFHFEANSQIVVIYTDSQTIDATWSTSQSSVGVVVSFSNVAGPNIQAITGEWLVVECETDRLELHRGDDILVLERNCE
ncbi:hypothetical protein [Winogradskyella sp. PG-2]|uniref:hypothetical protein n=1 Tax=Winogradskyella sp. PG-2 TaxID=754409 RepID=UPI000458858A|nr:hypothetical protein [Winogradskyella sp. PG-2]BAO74715.1 hypothetical protein WPG_0485 [Winogradskyella sp. PG-2]